MFMGGGFLILILVYGLLAAALFGIVYAAVRLGVFHAMKSHTRWVDRGKV
jgi:hypothetical protein